MATIDKKLIHFNRLADFEARLAAGDIRDYSIVCIKDAKLIWTHGEYYGDLSECLKVTQQTLTDEERIQVLENLGYYFLEWDGESETIQLSDEEYEKLKNATEVIISSRGDSLYLSTKSDSFLIFCAISEGFYITATVDMSRNPISISSDLRVIPTATSQLENDSDFVSAVDTGTEVDGVDVTYVTEAAMNAALSGKQDEIADIASIREGANKGATALQEEQYKGTVTSITAGDGLTGGTITESGTIGLEKLTSYSLSFENAVEKLQPLSYSNTYVNLNTRTDYVQMYPTQIGCDSYGRIRKLGDGSSQVRQRITVALEASRTAAGWMSASDKTKLDGIDMSTKQDKIEVVNHGTSDTTFTLTPNVYHKWGEVTSLSLTLATPSDDTVYNEYMFEFVSGNTATTLTLPDTIKWVSTPDIKENMIYQCSVVNSIGIFVAVSSLISFTILGNSYVASDGMTWEQWCNSDYNTDGLTIGNGMVFHGGSSYVSSEDGFVLPTDEIKGNYAYGTTSNEPV